MRANSETRCLLIAALFATVVASGQTAEQSFKNITHLKGTPAEQLMPAMQFINAALGVECSFCHVQGKMDADEKLNKKKARDMMTMTAALNKDSFGGRQEITCYTCHQGQAHPGGMPPVQATFAAVARPAANPAAAAARAAVPPTPPSVDAILSRYVTAMGGEEAIRKIQSRHQRGVIESGGTETPVDVYTKAPNKRVSITHGAQGDSITAFDGTAGWMGNTGRPARGMSPSESWASSLDSEFHLPLRIRDLFPQLRAGRPAQVNGFECDTITANAPGRPPVRLFFDKETGLLMRMVRYADTPVGRNVTQVDYADFRKVDGVMTPHRWTLARPNGRFAIQVASVKNNVEIEDARFAKPAADAK